MKTHVNNCGSYARVVATETMASCVALNDSNSCGKSGVLCTQVVAGAQCGRSVGERLVVPNIEDNFVLCLWMMHDFIVH